jgi:MscS family membrane protein
MLRLGFASCLLAVSLLASALAAQETAPGQSPRSAMLEYLTACRAGDYDTAARYLDLRELPPRERRSQGPALARRLKAVLDRTLWVELEALSEAPEGDLEDGLPPGRERVGTIDTPESSVELLLERRAGAEPAWRISPVTLAAVPALSEQLGLDWPRERLPAALVETRFLELELWQWLALPALLALSVLGGWLLAWLAAALLRRLARGARLGERLVAASLAPARLLLALLVFASGRRFLSLAVPVERGLGTLLTVLVVGACAWLVLRAVDVASARLEERLRAEARSGAVGLVPLARRVTKAFLVALALIAVLQNLGVNVTGILAGLGVGGLAVALAAQKTVENLFGGVTLAADQPVRVGDFCRFGDKLGTVEEIGMRSTRVRTLDRTVVTVPNAEFSALALENFTSRDRIWFHALLGLRYETGPDQMRHVLAGLRRVLRGHPRVDPDPARVRFVGFGESSLDLEVFAYVRTRDINEFLEIQEELLLAVMDAVAASGTGFAFPSRTIYATRDAGLDQERAARAAEEARSWRERDAPSRDRA